MTTISFSVEDKIARDIAAIAKRTHKSKSDVLRDMYAQYERGKDFEKEWRAIQDKMMPVLESLGLETEQALYDYLESDQTYEDRLRQQRLHRSGPSA